jgi:hypothetical protein
LSDRATRWLACAVLQHQPAKVGPNHQRLKRPTVNTTKKVKGGKNGNETKQKKGHPESKIATPTPTNINIEEKHDGPPSPCKSAQTLGNPVFHNPESPSCLDRP